MSFILIRIGRKSDNDIVLKNSSVSGRHAEIFVNEEGVVFLTDLNSTNGTYINGNKVQGSVLLKKGDILRLGADKPVPWLTWIEKKQAEMSQPVMNPLSNPEDFLKGRSRKNSVTELILGLLIILFLVLIGFFVFKDIGGEKKKTGNTDTTSSVNKNGETGTDTVSNAGNDKPAPKVDRQNIAYDYSCMGDDWLVWGNDLKKEVLDAYGTKVTVRTEIEYGDRLHEDMKSQYKIITSGKSYENLKHIFQILTSNIIKPRGFPYRLYMIESDEVNAFTCGGRVYFTTAMYKFCRDEHELACVLGHEIYHNELGHIREGIRLSSFEGGDLLGLLTISFNQKNEVECDLHGIDLANYSRYEGCAAVSFWKRMQESDSEGGELENFFRSHPFSGKRSDCSRRHIRKNYDYECNE